MKPNRYEADWSRQWKGKAEGRERGEGLSIFAAKMTNMLPMFDEVVEWFSPYRRVWRCDALRTLISYCEDDLNATQYFDDSRYAKYVQRATEFYLTSDNQRPHWQSSFQRLPAYQRQIPMPVAAAESLVIGSRVYCGLYGWKIRHRVCHSRPTDPI